jgi:hypothetical protein
VRDEEPMARPRARIHPGTHVDPVIHARELRKTFHVPEREAGLKQAMRSLVRRRTREVCAVDGICFEIEPGEVVGFLGPNGGLQVPCSGRGKRRMRLRFTNEGATADRAFFPPPRGSSDQQRLDVRWGARLDAFDF